MGSWLSLACLAAINSVVLYGHAVVIAVDRQLLKAMRCALAAYPLVVVLDASSTV